MNNNTKIQFLSPMLLVPDMPGSVKFFEEVLQFERIMDTPTYSIVRRESASIHLQVTSDPTAIEHIKNNQSIYIEVVGLEAFWAHVEKYKELYKMREPFDRDYGMREFHIIDGSSGTLVFVGEPFL